MTWGGGEGTYHPLLDLLSLLEKEKPRVPGKCQACLKWKCKLSSFPVGNSAKYSFTSSAGHYLVRASFCQPQIEKTVFTYK
jgi:hypothetical protein